MLDADQFRREWDAGATKAEKKRLERNLAKSRTKDSLKAFDKLTHLVDGEPRIIADPPLIVPIEDLLGPDEAAAFVDAIRAIIRSYRRTLPADRRLLLERFRYVDGARKVVGVGSVGTRAWVVLMVGNDGNDPSSCRSRRPRRRCSSASSARASSPTTASGSWRDNGSCNRPATSCSAGSAPPASTA